MNKNSAENLYEVAAAQGGFFTAFQATKAGFNPRNHSYHVRVGNWVREWRSIYRLSRFPLQEDAQYSLWGVWSLNRNGELQGAYSHETALSLFGLTDLQPEKLHMTVPRGYRRHGAIPKVLWLHHANVAISECEERTGYRVTKPYRTIIDLLHAHTTSPEFIRQAVKQSLERGYLTQAQFLGLKERPRIGKSLSEIMKASP